MSEFSPRQLDAIEDALEELEGDGVPAELFEGDEAQRIAANRLEDYRKLLVLTREALPMEDVPDGVLDSVLAEAREASAVAEVTPSERAARASLWDRLRRSFLLPLVAVAGAAALVLIIVQPMGGEAEAPDGAVAVQEVSPPPPPGPAAKDEAAGRLADASLRAEAESTDKDGFADAEAGRGQGVLAEDEVAEEELAEEVPYSPEPPAVAPAEPADDAFGDEDKRIKDAKPRRRSRKSSSKSSPSSGAGGKLPPLPSSGQSKKKAEPSAPPPPPADEPEPEPEPEPAPEQKNERDAADPWLLIEEGDKLRRSGQCTMAAKKYKQAQLASDRSVRARALAGQGLCRERAGDLSGAEKLYEDAKKLDASLGEYIDSQR